MMIPNLIGELRQKRIEISVQDDQLTLSGRKELLTPELIAALRTHKPQVIAYLKASAIKNSPISALHAGDAVGERTLSFAQQRFWFLDQLQSGNTMYNQVAAARLNGTLDADALRRAFDHVVARHEVLRSIFVSDSGQPQVRVLPRSDATLRVVDLQGLSKAQQQQDIKQQVQSEASTAFDLARGPLIRAILLRLTPHQHVLVVTLHHIITDAWSNGVLIREIGALYAAFVARQPSPLPALSIQYCDFAHWQRQWLAGDMLEQQLDYWTTQLDGAPSLLSLPTDRPRPPVQTSRGACLEFDIAAPTATALAALCQRTHSTMFMVIMAAFQVFLARYAGQDDICVGTSIANRNRAELEPLIGCFINTLVMRARVRAADSFLDLLGQVRVTALGAYMHQDIPFEQVVDALQPERQSAYTPLFQVSLLVQSRLENRLALPGLEVEMLNPEAEVAKFDLTLDVEVDGDQLHGKFRYNCDLFDATTIARMAGHFYRLLDSVAADPGCRIADLPMLSDGERQQLLVGWNDSAATVPTAQTLHQCFESQAAQTPDAIALVFAHQQLRYAELNARANQLAHRLRTLGVGPDRLVALCADRSIEMVVGLLAVLKAGGAYVPLDPAYPGHRLAYMLDDARPAVLLTQQHLLAGLPAHALPCVCIENGGDGYPDSNPAPVATPAHLAYVIYTSGSTGKPKGVQIAHRSALNLVNALVAEVYQGRADLAGLRIGVNASFSFDASVKQLLLILKGATLYLLPQDMRIDTHALAGALRQWRLDGLDCTPSQLSPLLDICPPAELPTYLLIGGEAIDDHLWQRLCHQPGKRFYNVYGPTETTVDATVCRIGPDQTSPCLGRPIANVQVYILDTSLNPVPVGVAGELHIAGAGLARGYLNRPELSAEKFIPDPFSAQPGARMYKSGDLVRWRADGTVEYLGRIDNQVKIRGFRIELGEIEAAVAALPGVRKSIVIVREDQPGEKRLVAYLVPHAAAPLDLDGMRAALLALLPDYMVPAHAVVLDTLPLSPNGKVDRKALPAPETARGSAGYTAARTATEAELSTLWAGLLSLDKVSIYDNFFLLGGHSLLAMQFIATVRKAFEVDVTLKDLFADPTLGGFAAIIDAARKQTEAPIVPAVRGQALPLSFAQQRLWFLDRLQPNSAFYNVPGAVRLSGALDQDALSRTLDEIVRRHEILRTTFVQVDGSPVQQIAPPAPLPLPLIDVSGAADPAQAVRDELQAAADTPFDLERGPLLRARLLRVARDEHVLMLTLHHIITDGWSNGVLVKEIAALYGAYAAQQPSPLPELAIQYADYAHWQRQWLAGDVLDRQLDYWTGQLGGAPGLLALPADRPRPAVQSFRGATLPFSVDARTTAALAALSQRTQSTLFMTLMAAFQVLLARYAGQDDISVGTPIANRNRAEIEPLIGCFINTLVMRAQVRPHERFLDLLDQVRTAALGAYAHQDIPFEQLVDSLQPERHLGHTPLFQAMLVLQNTPQASISLPGLAAEPLAAENNTAKFDLLLDLNESGNGLNGRLEYNTDLFDTVTIERMAGHFKRLLQAVAADPTLRISELPMLSDAEHQQLLAWNDTGAVFNTTCSGGDTLHQRIEAQAVRTPDAIALVFEHQQLSYAGLNAHANQLAHRLRTLGVGPDRLVALCAERSIDMVVGLLAILKAGGAYIPLDPAYPAERLAYMLDDAQPTVLLAQRHLLDALPAHALPCVCLEDGGDGQPDTNPGALAGPQHLAYVIYTSGSTGKPKGAAIAHAGIVNRLDWMQQAYQLTAADRVLQKTPYSFDVSVWEFFWPLREGATLVVTKPGGHQDPQYLADLMASQRITTVHFVPPMLDTFLHVLPDRWQHVLRQVICSGEALPFELQQRFLARFPQDVALHNLYGPTEASVDVTCHACQSGADGGTVPIGRPIANIQIHILDASLQPVPVGAAGELYIAGIGLARGYLNRPALSAEKFIPNPFSAQPGARMYRSGDLARRLPDGAIEYLGRIDNQVKIRGFRIELGEIEAAVAALPGVRESIVLVREDQPGDKRLVAYLVADAASDIDLAGLRAALLQSLPDYMVPAHAVVLDALPLTANGKVDRKALPAPDMTRSQAGHTAPATPTEEALAAIWAEVLALDGVGIHDNFFDLGGNSLMATRVVSRIRDMFDVALPLRSLFERPTIEATAEQIEVLIIESLADMSDEEASALATQY